MDRGPHLPGEGQVKEEEEEAEEKYYSTADRSIV